MVIRTLVLIAVFVSSQAGAADLLVHSAFSDHTVVQRDKPILISGVADVGERISVAFAGQEVAATTDKEHDWEVVLAARPADETPQDIVVTGNDRSITIKDVLIGDVWILGGQSNMEHEITSVYDGDLERASANYPGIRLLTIPQSASAFRKSNFFAIDEFNSWTNSSEQKGSWAHCTPESLKKFSAIGYIFGRRLHLVGKVPIGLIDASRGGTTVEAWTSYKTLAKIPDAVPLLEMWDQKVRGYDRDEDLQKQIANWERQTAERKKRGQAPNPKPTEPRPGPAFDPNYPGNSYNGMIACIDGLAVRGVIFNQGYNNALGDARPALYAKTIQAMIHEWRSTFRDEQLPFGIVGMTAGGDPQTHENFELRMVDAAPYIREAQYLAAQQIDGVEYLPAWDQQMRWYHPFKKVALGERLARWALATTMDQPFPWKPAAVEKVEIADGKITISFDQGVEANDGRPLEGLAIAGADQHFFPANAEWLVTGKDKNNRDQYDRRQVVVSCPLVEKPVAVRHAWARNPIGNLTHQQHHLRQVPVPSFRTDDWPYPEAPIADGRSGEMGKHRGHLNELRRQAEQWAAQRKIMQAEHVLASTKEN